MGFATLVLSLFGNLSFNLKIPPKTLPTAANCGGGAAMTREQGNRRNDTSLLEKDNLSSG